MAHSAAQARPRARVRPRRRVRQFVPPQHGAWAMLIVPYLAAVPAAGAEWVHLPLLGAWLAGYLMSYYAFLAIKARRARRCLPQLAGYGAVALPLAAVVVAARPAVLWYAPAFALLLAVNAWYAWRRRERALLNDVASVLQSCLLVFVVGTVAAVPPEQMLRVFVACAAYFLGTIFYVKTMIRERDNPSYRRWSVAFHAVALGVSAWLGPWFVPLFAWLLVRAWLLPERRLSPKQVGLIEIANSTALLLAIWFS